MESLLLFSMVFLSSLLNVVTAQSSASSSSRPIPTTTSAVSLTPEMSASAVSSLYSVLATTTPQQSGSGPAAGDAGSSPGGGSDAGASGPDTGSITLSKGGVIAIIVVAVLICVGGAVSAILFYLAKKRDWQIRATIRKSARRVATALTPRRSTFPKDVHKKRRSTRGLTKIDEVPNTPGMRGEDVEKGTVQMSSFELAEPPKKSKWAAKTGR